MAFCPVLCGRFFRFGLPVPYIPRSAPHHCNLDCCSMLKLKAGRSSSQESNPVLQLQPSLKVTSWRWLSHPTSISGLIYIHRSSRLIEPADERLIYFSDWFSNIRCLLLSVLSSETNSGGEQPRKNITVVTLDKHSFLSCQMHISSRNLKKGSALSQRNTEIGVLGSILVASFAGELK